jgi:hypothetical protein
MKSNSGHLNKKAVSRKELFLAIFSNAISTDGRLLVLFKVTLLLRPPFSSHILYVNYGLAVFRLLSS